MKRELLWPTPIYTKELPNYKNLNKHLWTLSKNHKGLLWRLTAMCGSTFVLFHKWIYPKKTKTNTKSKY